jgi:CelD/BcsL family acetyltransferase involved in cellulose biosynthesis
LAEDPARAFAKVEIHREPAPVLDAWAELEGVAPASAYQTRAFLLPWLETLGAARKIEPLFITAKDQMDRVTALLCLGIERYGWFRCAAFLGGKESNFNLGLFRPDAGFEGADLMALLRAAASALGPEAPDLFLLKNQPFEWEGAQNPFARFAHRPSPSPAYATALASDAGAFLAVKLSKDARKKLRKKEARLSAMGPLALIGNDDREAAGKILDGFFAEKIARCEEQAIDCDFSNPAMRAFFDRLCRKEAGKSWLELYGLTLGGRIIATYAGAVHRAHFSAMVNSFDADPEIAKSSPGDLLLMKLVARQCERGIASFDLGIGEARYKATYCDRVVPLFDVAIPLGVKGHLFALLQSLSSRLKLAIKQNPRVLARLRRWKRFAF